jgi:ketosteroid isomerase-like protein
LQSLHAEYGIATQAWSPIGGITSNQPRPSLEDPGRTAEYSAAMPQEDVEVVRRIFAAFRERDLEAFLGYLDPDVEFRSLILEIEGAYHGFDGATEWWADLLSVFPDWSPSIEETRKVADRVIVRVRAEGRGTGSGVAQARDIWQVAEVRDGRVRSSAFFRTEREALEAVQRE